MTSVTQYEMNANTYGQMAKLNNYGIEAYFNDFAYTIDEENRDAFYANYDEMIDSINKQMNKTYETDVTSCGGWETRLGNSEYRERLNSAIQNTFYDYNISSYGDNTFTNWVN